MGASRGANRIGAALRSILPGLFLVGFNIGTGSVTSMAKAGATHGMSLLWALAISCFITWRLIALYGRLTIVSGDTALRGFRAGLGAPVAWFFVVALGANVLGSVMGVMGIVADVSTHVIQSVTGFTVGPLVFAAVVSAAIVALYWLGRHATFEKVLALLVAVMGVCFLANLAFVAPSLGSVARGLVPGAPEGGPVDAWLVVASVVGTTVFSGLFIVRSTLVKEAGWTLADLRLQERDALVSASLMFVISGAIMASAAGAFAETNQSFESAADMLRLLEPLAGPAAAAIFGLGLLAAGVSSQFPNVVLVPWLVRDLRGGLNLNGWPVRLAVLGFAAMGLVVPAFGGRPILVMLVSQAFGSLLLPATVVCLAVQGNRRSVMGKRTFRWPDNVFLIGAFAFSLVIGGMGLRALWGLVDRVLNQ